MDELSKQVTLGKAYEVAAYAKTATVDQLFWAIERFHLDFLDIDEGARAQRSQARQTCAIELDRRHVPVRDPSRQPAFSPLMPDGPEPQLKAYIPAPARPAVAAQPVLPEWLTNKEWRTKHGIQ